MRHLACNPTAQTRGVAVLAFLEHQHGDVASRVLEKHGLGAVGLDDWVPTSHVLEALTELVRLAGPGSSLISIGTKISATIPMPEGMTLGHVCMSANDIYQRLHRSDVGAVTCEKLG